MTTKVRVRCDAFYGPDNADWIVTCDEHNLTITTWAFSAAMEAATGHLCMTHTA